MPYDLIVSIFQAYSVSKEFAEAYGTVADWVMRAVNRWSRGTSSKQIEGVADRLARATEAEIRKAADEKLRSADPPIPPDRREEMIGVVMNMARNVRDRSTAGSFRSSFFRSERLLDQLLNDVGPSRRLGEPVVPGSPWVLKKYLGMGSFGEVWMAENPGFPHPRAFKFFTRAGSTGSIRREQQALFKIAREIGDHPNVVDFEDVQLDNPTHPYLAFEHMAGGSLEEWILEDPARRPALEPLAVVRAIVAGLDAAHSKGITHCDLKPANVLIGGPPDREIKIGDFGLANVARAGRGAASTATATAYGPPGGLVGTAMYLPPEAHLRGERRSDYQDDIFALGVLWYQLVVGRIERPAYDYAEELAAAGLSAPAIRLIAGCLAHPGRRFPNASTLRMLLDEVDVDFPPLVPPASGIPDVQHIARDYLAAMAG